MPNLISFPLPFARDFAVEWPWFGPEGRPPGYKWFCKSSYETPLYRTTEIWLGNVRFAWDAPRKQQVHATV